MGQAGIADIIAPLLLRAGADKNSMKTLSSAKTELFRNFDANRCRAGDSCKYIHTLPPTGRRPSTPPQAARNAPPTKLLTKTVHPTYISAHQREKTEPFATQKFDSNPHGILISAMIVDYYYLNEDDGNPNPSKCMC